MEIISPEENTATNQDSLDVVVKYDFKYERWKPYHKIPKRMRWLLDRIAIRLLRIRYITVELNGEEVARYRYPIFRRKKFKRWGIEKTHTFNIDISKYSDSTVTLQAFVYYGRHRRLCKVSSDPISLIIDRTPPAIAVEEPPNGAEINTSTPRIVITYTDQPSGVDTSTLKVSINGEDKTSEFSINSDRAVGQLADSLPDGENTIKATINDKATNQASVTSTFTIITTPPITDKSGFIHGFVYNAKTDSPLPDAIVTARGIEGVVFTDADGKFTIPTPGTGTYEVTIKKEGFTSCQRRVRVVGTRDVAVEAAYLTPLDPKTTHIIAEEGGAATDSTQTIELDIPPGACPEDMDIRITAMEKLEDIPGPQEDFLCFVFCGKFQPDDVTFNGPITLCVDNKQNFPPGLKLPLTFWNKETLNWDNAGVGVVTADGQHIEFTINHFCYFHCNLYLIDEIEAFITLLVSKFKDLMKKAADPLNWWVDYKEAELSITHKLPPIRSLGLSNSLSLSYFSTTAYPQTLIDTEIRRILGGVAYQIGWALDIEGIHKEVKFKGIAENFKTAYIWDARNGRDEWVPTGSYPFTVTATNEYLVGGTFKYFTPDGQFVDVNILDKTVFEFKREGRAMVINNTNSPFGTGWSLDCLQRLYPDPDNLATVLWVQGGNASIYTLPPGSMPVAPASIPIGSIPPPVNYESPEGDYSLLSLIHDGTFCRVTKDGKYFYFDSKGFHTKTRDRNGNITTYTYNGDDLLTAITDPVGQVTHFSYDGSGHLSSITDPAGRTTEFNIDANGNLVSITNPDGTTSSYGYNQEHLLTSSTDSGGSTTTYIYEKHNRIKKIVMPDGETRQFQPGALQGLINDLPDGVGTPDNPADPIVGSDLDLFTDGEGHTTQFKTNKFGSIIEKKDPLGYLTVIERDGASNPTRIERPNGVVTTMTYDSEGNLLTTREESMGATTTFTYLPVINKVSSITVTPKEILPE